MNDAMPTLPPEAYATQEEPTWRTHQPRGAGLAAAVAVPRPAAGEVPELPMGTESDQLAKLVPYLDRKVYLGLGACGRCARFEACRKEKGVRALQEYCVWGVSRYQFHGDVRRLPKTEALFSAFDEKFPKFDLQPWFDILTNPQPKGKS